MADNTPIPLDGTSFLAGIINSNSDFHSQLAIGIHQDGTDALMRTMQTGSGSTPYTIGTTHIIRKEFFGNSWISATRGDDSQTFLEVPCRASTESFLECKGRCIIQPMQTSLSGSRCCTVPRCGFIFGQIATLGSAHAISDWASHVESHLGRFTCPNRTCSSNRDGFASEFDLLNHQESSHMRATDTAQPYSNPFATSISTQDSPRQYTEPSLSAISRPGRRCELLCDVPNCVRSERGNGFARKDNLTVHLRSVHKRAMPRLRASAGKGTRLGVPRG
ncbi:hypothetical protein BJ508DRAFT_372453 [Ascobolus immersus RN42]|uniref:C2H2-domain containing protein second zinc finger domain-containing protein n=1 Tax=Ascobolus immersus RN42 TaxID=1160509 RepID=A0A3N4IYE5_ASCIM|nr:hypothetical protein BJ508DRAFT_372453 [Ascobolus immersus RN42]